MADEAREWTDEYLAEMEDHLKKIYRQAQSEITAEWNKYMANGEDRLSSLYSAYLNAPATEKAEALKKYQDALQNYTVRNKWYQDMVNSTAYRLANVNAIAIAYINGEIPNVYLTNFNYIDSVALSVFDNWVIRDEYMIKNLIANTLPNKTLDYAKDMAWNLKQINSSVLQGILQGESIKKISDRLLPIVGNNVASAVRTARTMVTGAENRGRLDRYEDYQSRGLVMRKVWIATGDARTRDWHLSMDGQEVDVNDSFVDGNGNHLRFPGDPEAPGETVYNCRCAMKSHLIGVRMPDGSIRKFDDFENLDTHHEQQIAAEKERRGE